MLNWLLKNHFFWFFQNISIWHYRHLCKLLTLGQIGLHGDLGRIGAGDLKQVRGLNFGLDPKLVWSWPQIKSLQPLVVRHNCELRWQLHYSDEHERKAAGDKLLLRFYTITFFLHTHPHTHKKRIRHQSADFRERYCWWKRSDERRCWKELLLLTVYAELTCTSSKSTENSGKKQNEKWCGWVVWLSSSSGGDGGLRSSRIRPSTLQYKRHYVNPRATKNTATLPRRTGSPEVERGNRRGIDTPMTAATKPLPLCNQDQASEGYPRRI